MSEVWSVVREVQEQQLTNTQVMKKVTDLVLNLVEEAAGDGIVALISLIPYVGSFLANLSRSFIHSGIQNIHDCYVS